MEENVNRILKYTLLLFIFLNLIALLIPWGTITQPAYGRVDFYNWGAHKILTNGENEYIMNFMFLMPDITNNFFHIDNFNIGDIQIVFWIMILLFTALIIAFTTKFLIKKDYNKIDFSTTILFAILSIISFYIFFQFGITAIPGSTFFKFEYTTGFILAIISVVVLVISYLILDYSTKEEYIDDTVLESPIETLRLRYAKGEINKEEFERIKNDLEYSE